MTTATPNERVCLQNCFDTGSGGYWVRRIRQLPRAPLKIPHSRDHYYFGRKIAKLEIKSK